MALVECVPNFSEGRRAEVVDRIVQAATGVPGVAVLDRETDFDHNRSVLTLAGDPEGVLEAAFRAAREAARLIDLTRHQGEHPRIGATDVVPFVPLEGVGIAECVRLAERLGERLANDLGIPVYLYGEAARRPERRALPNVRKGEFEGLREAIGRDPARAPDFGPARLHPTAGATAVGARDFLIAFNVNLDTADLGLAKRIAASIREAGGGLPGVRAKGFAVDGGRTAQVSMNLVDFRKTSPGAATQAVEREAARAGVQVRETELVGLIPQEALALSAVDLLRMKNFQSDQVLERRLEARLPPDTAGGLLGFLESLASPEPAPGGGSAAALGGAVASALASMVLALSALKAPPEEASRMRDVATSERHRLRRFVELVGRDARAYEGVVRALGLPKRTPEEKAARSAQVQEALALALEVPLETMRQGVGALEALGVAARLGSRHALSDVQVGVLAGWLCVKGAATNVQTNLKSFKDGARGASWRGEMEALLAEALRWQTEVEQTLAARAREAG